MIKKIVLLFVICLVVVLSCMAIVNINSNDSSNIYHEATVSKISEENLLYLMSRGISYEKAMELIILGFINEFREELPMEYAVELNRLLSTTIGGM